jgi:hypothetical protein
MQATQNALRALAALRYAVAAVVMVFAIDGQAVAQVSPTGNYAQELQDFGVPPQQTLHAGEPHPPTPLSAPGAKTITTADLYGRLGARQPMILLYVNEAQDGLAIAGAHWLYGAVSPLTTASKSVWSRKSASSRAVISTRPSRFFASMRIAGSHTMQHCGWRRPVTAMSSGIVAGARPGRRPACR